MQAADVVIVGGGLVGASIAYHLLAGGRPFTPRGGRPARLVVVERDPTFQRASSALSMGGVRQQFSHPANVAMARHSIGVYERFADLLAVDGEPGVCELRQVGYLFLADDRNAAALLSRYEANRAAGVEVERLDQAGILARLPDLDLAGIRFGIFGRRDGYVDPHSIHRSYLRAARRLGAEWVVDEVVSVELDGAAAGGGRVSGVTTRGGLRLATRVLVNACGAWAARLGALAGAPVPVTPVRRQLYLVEPPRPVARDFPMTIDPTGVHFRPESGRKFLVGEGPDGGLPDPGAAGPAPLAEGPFPWDRERFVAAVWPRLAARVPMLEAGRLATGWAGLYEVSPDHNAILGEHPERPGFFLANGFSGHGVMMAPATGLALAELIRLGRYETLDTTPFRLSRFAEGRPIAEAAVL